MFILLINIQQLAELEIVEEMQSPPQPVPKTGGKSENNQSNHWNTMKATQATDVNVLTTFWS